MRAASGRLAAELHPICHSKTSCCELAPAVPLLLAGLPDLSRALACPTRRFVHRPNCVDLEAGEAALKGSGRYSELVALYQVPGCTAWMCHSTIMYCCTALLSVCSCAAGQPQLRPERCPPTCPACPPRRPADQGPALGGA